MFGVFGQRGLRRTLFAACGLASAAAVAPAHAQTQVKVLLDFRIQGPEAPFLVAIDRGYFRAEGLDVTVEPGNGSVDSVARVGSGAYEMGFGDINTLIRLHDQNPSAAPKAVFMVYNRPPFAIIGRKSRGIAKPKDLEDKKLAAPTGDAAFAQWPIFAKINDISAAKVTVLNVGFPVREPMLAAGEVDAVTGFSFTVFVDLKDKGVPVDDILVMLMADYGLDLYGNTILASPKFAAENPEAVKGFLRAYVKGLKDTVRGPSSAVDSVLKRNDFAKKDVELERLRMAIKDAILTPEVKTNGYGVVDAARLDRSIEQIGLVYKFKTKPKASEAFDDSFLPSATERKAN